MASQTRYSTITCLYKTQDCTLYKVQYHYLPVQDTGLHTVQGTVPLPASTRHRTALCTRYSTITCLYKTQDCTLHNVQYHYLPVQDTGLHSAQSTVPLPACTRYWTALCTRYSTITCLYKIQDCTLYKVQYHYLPVQDTGLHSVQGTVPLPACRRHRTALCTRYSTITCLYKTQDCTLYKVQYQYLPVQDTGLHSVQGTVPLPACTRHRTALCTRYSTITSLYKTQDCTLYKVQTQDCTVYKVQHQLCSSYECPYKYRHHLQSTATSSFQYTVMFLRNRMIRSRNSIERTWKTCLLRTRYTTMSMNLE